jgi:hypothetical protein
MEPSMSAPGTGLHGALPAPTAAWQLFSRTAAGATHLECDLAGAEPFSTLSGEPYGRFSSRHGLVLQGPYGIGIRWGVQADGRGWTEGGGTRLRVWPGTPAAAPVLLLRHLAGVQEPAMAAAGLLLSWWTALVSDMLAGGQHAVRPGTWDPVIGARPDRMAQGREAEAGESLERNARLLDRDGLDALARGMPGEQVEAWLEPWCVPGAPAGWTPQQWSAAPALLRCSVSVRLADPLLLPLSLRDERVPWPVSASGRALLAWWLRQIHQTHQA